MFFKPAAQNYTNQFTSRSSRRSFNFIQLTESAVTKMRLKSIKQSILKIIFKLEFRAFKGKFTATFCDNVIAQGNVEQISPVLKLAFRLITNIIDSFWHSSEKKNGFTAY